MPFFVATTITRDDSWNWPGSPLRSARCRRETLLLKSRIAQSIACWQATTLLPRRLTTAKDHLHLLHHGPRGLKIEFFPQLRLLLYLLLAATSSHYCLRRWDYEKARMLRTYVWVCIVGPKRPSNSYDHRNVGVHFASIGCLHPPASPLMNNPIDNKKRDKIIRTTSAATASAEKLEDPYTVKHTR